MMNNNQEAIVMNDQEQEQKWTELELWLFAEADRMHKEMEKNHEHHWTLDEIHERDRHLEKLGTLRDGRRRMM